MLKSFSHTKYSNFYLLSLNSLTIKFSEQETVHVHVYVHVYDDTFMFMRSSSLKAWIFISSGNHSTCLQMFTNVHYTSKIRELNFSCKGHCFLCHVQASRANDKTCLQMFITIFQKSANSVYHVKDTTSLFRRSSSLTAWTCTSSVWSRSAVEPAPSPRNVQQYESYSTFVLIQVLNNTVNVIL